MTAYNSESECLSGQGAGETGVAEAYMCSRIMRDPLVRQCVAEYQGEFIADASDGGFTKGTQWLVWKFESDSTLGDALSVRHTPDVVPNSHSEHVETANFCMTVF